MIEKENVHTGHFWKIQLIFSSISGYVRIWFVFVGSDVNSTDNGGLSSLHDAANHGFLEIAKALVEAGAQVNREGKDNSHRYTKRPLFFHCILLFGNMSSDRTIWDTPFVFEESFVG